MRLVLLRHGLTLANEQWLYCGSTDLPLSEKGREELRSLRLRGGYPDLRGFRVYTSGLRRTEETLCELYGEVEHTALPALREVDFGAFEMRSYDELKADPAFRAWCEGDNERNVPPGGESGRQMEERVLAALTSLLREGRDFLLMTHGGPIASIMASLFPEEGKNRWQWQPRNGEGYLVVLDQKKYWKSMPEGDRTHG